MSHAYLFAYFALTELFLGCLLILLFYPMVEPSWLKPLLPAARSAQRLAIPLTIGFAVLAALAHSIYPWAHPATRHFSPYLTLNGFYARGAIYWFTWLYISRVALRGSNKASAPATVVVGFTASFAAIDWVLSLTPEFGSTAFGLLVFVSALLMAFGFTAFFGAPVSSEKARQDQGSVHLALVCVWTYVAFMQFLVVWAGNLPREVAWYDLRSTHGWALFAALLATLQFAIPFLLLLQRRVKRSGSASRALAGLSLAMQLLFAAWQTLPQLGGLLPALPALGAGLALTLGGLFYAGKETHAT